MSSAEQIAHYLRNCKWFAGVYPSDKLPDPPISLSLFLLCCSQLHSGYFVAADQWFLAAGTVEVSTAVFWLNRNPIAI